MQSDCALQYFVSTWHMAACSTVVPSSTQCTWHKAGGRAPVGTSLENTVCAHKQTKKALVHVLHFNVMLPIQHSALLMLGKRRRTMKISAKSVWYKPHVACTRKRYSRKIEKYSKKDFSMKTTALRAQYIILLSALCGRAFGSE